MGAAHLVPSCSWHGIKWCLLLALKLTSHHPYYQTLPSLFAADPKYCAFPGIINGGVVSAIFDCHGNWTAAIALMDRACLPKPPLTLTFEMLVRQDCLLCGKVGFGVSVRRSVAGLAVQSKAVASGTAIHAVALHCLFRACLCR